jgi:Cu+-exporting ATPase
MDAERRERIRYYGFAGFVGLLLALNLTGVFRTIFGFDTAILITVLAGYKTFHNSVSALLEKRISADIALCVAVIAATAVGEYAAAAEAMFIVLVGEGLESYAAGRTEAAIARFVEQLPRRARVLRNGIEEDVDATDLVPGDLILVRAGERIAADGAIDEGTSSVDESSITGEPLPRDKQAGDEVFSGTLNGNGLLHVRVSRAGAETTLARVVRLVQDAKEGRAPVERLADRYARYFLPALLAAAGLTWYFTGDWLRTVAVLIVACPCALILATPTAMVAAIGGLARRGVLVRSGAVLQQAAEVDMVVFDKTGTVTEGRFEIISVLPLDRSPENLLALAAAAERASEHTLARVIVAEAARRHLTLPEPQDARVVPGRGVECTLEGRTIRAGNAGYLAEYGVAQTESLLAEADRLGATAVLVADGERLAGAILLRDRIREGIRDAAAKLRSMGVTHQVLLTGDRLRAAEVVARDIGIPDVEAELLPEQKLDRIRQWMAQGRKVAMIGDGINDAPSLAAATVGVAVAGACDITAEAAHVVYMPHSLEQLPVLFDLSKRAMATAWQNIILFAGFVNLTAVLFCATGKIGPIGAAFTHQLSSFLVMMNSLRLLRVPRGSTREFRFPALTIEWRAWLQRFWALRGRYLRPALYAGLAALALNGFYSLQPGEVGVIERFGKQLLPYAQPGLHYKLPWPIERLNRVQATRIRTVEIGFRASSSAPETEPAAYEWNVQHRSGLLRSVPEESFILTGDQNMIELNATVHYNLSRIGDFLFHQFDGDTTVRAAAESVLESIATSCSMDDLLTTGRSAIEARMLAELQQRLNRYRTGVRIIRVKLEDVHPSVEVVDAFRDVSGAYEEKNQLIDEADAYRNEQVALARGNARARVVNAGAYRFDRENRAEGDAGRFIQREAAFRSAPGPNELRLYLETIDQVLPGKDKMIIDSKHARRHLLLLGDGVELAPPGAAAVAPRALPGEN